MFTYEQITSFTNTGSVEQQLLSMSNDQGIQTSNWKSGSPELTIIKLMAYEFTQMQNRIAQTARYTINRTSSGSALTYLADSHFNNQRNLANFSEGQMVLTGSSNYVPRTWQSTEMRITDGTYTFYNIDPITISNAIPYVTTSFRAEESGEEYNIPIDSDLSIIGVDLGFTITNPVYQYGISGSWLTQLGSDDETDETLQQRNATTFSSFQTGDLTVDRVKRMALSASTDLTKVSIDDSNPRGPFTVDVYLSQNTETADASSVQAVQTILNGAFFGNSASQLVIANAATAVEFDRGVTIYYSKAANPSNVVSNTEVAADNWIGSINIGGNDYSPYGRNIAYLGDLITNLNNVDGVERVVVVSSSTDITLTIDQKLISPVSGWNSIISYLPLTIL